MNTTFRVLRQFYQYNHDQAVVCAALGIGKSTLRNLLIGEGTSFSELLYRWRRRHLQALLKQGKTQDCIAFELSYASPKQFRHAFKGFMGITWTEYQREMNNDMRLVRVA